MLKFKSLEDRQVLIEEIYAELEELLLQKEGNATEEEEINEYLNRNGDSEEEDEFSEKAISRRRFRTIQQANLKTMTESQKKSLLDNLLAELEEKKALLEQSLINLNQIIQTNVI